MNTGDTTFDRMNLKARLAIAMVERWGMVQAEPDGEDRAGRARLGLMPVEKVVGRACDAADALVSETERRGWVAPEDIQSDPAEVRARGKWFG